MLTKFASGETKPLECSIFITNDCNNMLILNLFFTYLVYLFGLNLGASSLLSTLPPTLPLLRRDFLPEDFGENQCDTNCNRNF